VKYLIFFLLLLNGNLYAQSTQSLFYSKIDTLYSYSKSGGEKLDSVDFIFSDKHSVLPGGAFNSPYGRFGNDYFNSLEMLNSNYRMQQNIVSKFAALPKLSFNYTFGSYGLQILHTDYYQTFRKNIFLTFMYDRYVTSGMVRRNQLSQDALSIRVLHKGKKSENRVDFKSFIFNRELTGGIVNDSVYTQFGIESANINKLNTTDTLKKYLFETEHFLNLWGDSIMKNGLYLKNSLSLDQRTYRETDDLYNLYSSFRDSLNTVDKIQFSRLDNETGYLLKTKRFKFSTALNRGYWRFFTLGSQTRTEWDFRSNMVTQLTDNLEMHLKLNVNLIGANFQRNVDLNMIQRGTNFSHIFNAGWNQLLPNPNQRTYFSNTLDFQIDQPELQKNLFFSYQLTSNKKDFSFSIGLKSMQDYYFFDGISWNNQLFSKVGIFYTNLVKTFQWKSLYVQPNLTFTSLSGVNQVLPKFDFRGRFFWKKRIFANKMEVLVGTDVYSRSSYNAFSYEDRLALYTISSVQSKVQPILQFDALFAVNIDEFRFYFKAENLNDYTKQQKVFVVKNYPNSPSIFRIGFTWDFVN